MTEEQWLACGNARTMLTFLAEAPVERKLRLFTCACWRLRWQEIAHPASAQAVATAERYADGWCPQAEVDATRPEAYRRFVAAYRASAKARRGTNHATLRAAQGRERAALAAVWMVEQGYLAAATGVLKLTEEGAAKKQRAACADLVLEVFGNPFRSTSVDPARLTWNGGLVWRLAQSIYDERRFGDLGVLADALEEAGCDNADLLGHLRGPGPHVRGCWVLDLLLGKE